MKKFFGWVFRIVCIVIILGAAVTLGRSFLHRNDDHSAEALLGDINYATGFGSTEEEVPLSAPDAATSVIEDAEEYPTISLYQSEKNTMSSSTEKVVALIGGVRNSIIGTLNWYVNGELVQEMTDNLLVDGSTIPYDVSQLLRDSMGEPILVQVQLCYHDQIVEAELEVAPPETTVVEDDATEMTIRTTEIPVTATVRTKLYSDSALEQETGTMKKDESGLLLGYEKRDNNLFAIQLLLTDGSRVWVAADDVEISEEPCTTDQDYSEAEKVEFMNSMDYDSQTDYLVWVNLYTQKVNIFKGYKGNWKLEKVFACASGLNTSPTSTGVYTFSVLAERWNLSDNSYVSPVMVFNGGEAFTSQPYDTQTGKVMDATIGEPATGGGVRLLKDDIEWMTKVLPIGTMIVVY